MSALRKKDIMKLRHAIVPVTFLVVTVLSSSAYAEATIAAREVRRRALFGVGLEGAAAYPLDGVNRDLFGWGGTIAARVELNVHPALGIEVGAAGIILSRDQSPNRGSWYGGRAGLRFHWSALAGWASQDGWIDAHYNVGLSGDFVAMGFDVGTGFEFALGRSFRIGPYARYQFGYDPMGQHAQTVFVGVTIGLLGDPRLNQTIVQDESGEEVVESVEAVLPPPRESEDEPARCMAEEGIGAHPPAVDMDGDGLPNATDHCPMEPSGAMPHPSRPGCPARDHDGDGVRDAQDLCPTEPVGASPDPVRPGCPIRDHDGDGIIDNRDLCPSEPVGGVPDSRNVGCPVRDRDSDGIADDVDQCPDRPAGDNPAPGRRGCPR